MRAVFSIPAKRSRLAPGPLFLRAWDGCTISAALAAFAKPSFARKAAELDSATPLKTSSEMSATSEMRCVLVSGDLREETAARGRDMGEPSIMNGY